ncbi:MAG: glycosyltransferase [Flavobacteriales bacterium]
MLSVVIIAKNEAHNLPRCLQSVKGLADEVVVVDSGSTDGTLEVCAQYGAAVHQRDFTTYADQKNWAADQAAHPYVLSLDADESLSDDLLKELTAWKTLAASSDELPFDAWSLPRLTSYLGTRVRHGGWYPDRKIRLWRQGTGDWQPAHEGGMLHEAWIPRIPSRVGQLKGDLHHHSYHRFSDHLRQLAKFSTLGAADARLQGRSSHLLTPWFRMVFQWFKQAVVQSGWRDGVTGFRIARWSAVSAHWKWRQVHAAQAWDARQTVGIVRTDALGDNVLSLPMAGALKAHHPEVKVVWICKPYAADVARACGHVDEIRTWDGTDHKVVEGLDAVVFAFPEPALVCAAAKAGVPVRVATGRRWVTARHATRRVWRSRKTTPAHETLQGLRLLHGLDVPAALRFPEASDWHGLLEMTPPLGASVAQAATGLSNDLWSRLVVLHPGNHGSANGWSVDRFQALGHRLTQAGWVVAVTGTEAERKALGPWLSESDVVDLVGKLDMPGLLGVLAHAKLCVASSTGPLHLASAFGTPVVGLYQAQAPFWPARWAPLGRGAVLETRQEAPEGGLDISVQDVADAAFGLLA